MDIKSYLHKKYQKFGRGPDVFDCWGLVVYFYKNEFGIELDNQPIDPDDFKALILAGQSERLKPVWTETKIPRKGVVVGAGRGSRIHHSGVMLDGKHVMHITKQSGRVVVEKLHRFRSNYPLTTLYDHCKNS